MNVSLSPVQYATSPPMRKPESAGYAVSVGFAVPTVVSV